MWYISTTEYYSGIKKNIIMSSQEDGRKWRSSSEVKYARLRKKNNVFFSTYRKIKQNKNKDMDFCNILTVWLGKAGEKGW
jgi:TPP-dependent pyruvate/acetoin dehydrogenase alpha subunit